MSGSGSYTGKTFWKKLGDQLLHKTYKTNLKNLGGTLVEISEITPVGNLKGIDMKSLAESLVKILQKSREVQWNELLYTIHEKI